MNDHGYEELTPQQRMAQDAVRGLPRPAADPDFRARLLQEFVSGEIDAGEAADAGAPGAPSDAAPAEVVSLPSRSSAARRVWAGAGSLALAAVIVLMFFLTNTLPGPELAGDSGEGVAVIDGRSVPVSDRETLATLLRPGARLELRDGASLDIRYPGSLVWRISSGTEMTLPQSPGRWIGRVIAADLAQGELSVRTGPDFGGNSLVVSTPEGRAVVFGTLISVVAMPDLTCICLHEGTARIETGTTVLGFLPEGKRWVIYRDGREPELLDIMPAHDEHMLGLDADHED